MEAIARRPSRKLLILLVALGSLVMAVPFVLAVTGSPFVHLLRETVTSESYSYGSLDPGVRQGETEDHSTHIRHAFREIQGPDGSWIKEGPSVRLNRNGQKLEQGRYANGKREGQWMYWKDDRSIDPDRSGVYENDLRVRPAWSITLERTISDEIRPVYKVTVTGDGSVRYEGVTFVRMAGTQEAQISVDAVSRIQQRAQAIHLFETNFQCGIKSPDGPHVIIEAMDGSRSVRFDSLWNGEKEDPDASTHIALEGLADLIDEVVGTDRWIK